VTTSTDQSEDSTMASDATEFKSYSLPHHAYAFFAAQQIERQQSWLGKQSEIS